MTTGSLHALQHPLGMLTIDQAWLNSLLKGRIMPECEEAMKAIRRRCGEMRDRLRDSETYRNTTETHGIRTRDITMHTKASGTAK